MITSSRSLGTFPARGLVAPVAEGGRDRGRPVRPDRGGSSSGRGDQPRAHERGSARHGTGRRGQVLGRRAPCAPSRTARSWSGTPMIWSPCAHPAQQAEQVKARLAGWLEPRGLAFNEDKTQDRPPRPGVRLPGVHHPPLSERQAADQAEQGGDATDPGTAVRRGTALRGANADAVIATAQPDHHRVGRLLPDRGVQARLRRAGRPPVEARLQMGQVLPPEQAEALDHRPVLRHVQPGQAGQVGVRQPGNRLLPPQVRLDQNRPAPDGRRAGVPRRPRPDRVLGPAPRRRNRPPVDPATWHLLRRQRGRCPLCRGLLLHADRQPQEPGANGSSGTPPRARRSASTRSPA